MAGALHALAERTRWYPRHADHIVGTSAGAGWVDHPNTWIVACDYQTGDRVVFGRKGEPEIDIDQAVAASCAIPGYYCPEAIDGRSYVDGGMHSMSNLDLLLGLDLDLAI